MQYIPLNAASIDSTLSAWLAQFPQMGVLALLPEAEKGQVPLLQEICRQRGIPLVGAIFPALVTPDGFVTAGAWLLRFDRRIPTALIPALNSGTPGAVEKIGAAVRRMLAEDPSRSREPALYMIFDGMVPNITSILDGLYGEFADQLAYAGANAGSETFQPMPCLFDQDQWVGDGVLCLLLSGAAVTVLEHGFSQPGKAICATVTDGNRIAMIDGRPAFDVYQELIKAQYDIDLTRENFYQHAVHFPFGILRSSSGIVVRIPVAITDDGSIFCVGEVPPHAMLVLLKAPPAGADGCLERLASTLERENGPLAGRQLLTCYCAGRRLHLGQAAETELATLNARIRPGAFGGVLSLGEIGSTSQSGDPLFHNATLVCTPWSNA